MQLHAGVGSLHQSLTKCLETLKRFAWWKTIRSDTEREIRKCDVCGRSRKWPKAKHGPLQDWPASRPFQRAHVDLCGEFPMSRNGNKFCLTYCDYFSKYLIAIPLKDKSALTVAQALVEHVYLKIGLVEIEVSDLGREFINEIRSNVHKLLQIQPVRSVAYRPNINAAIERIHRTMHQMLMKVVDTDQRNWDKVLPYVVFAYNNATHSATNFTPYFLVHGRHANLPYDYLTQHPTNEHYESYDDYTMQVDERLHYAFDLVRNELKASFERNKRCYDERVRELQFEPGDLVWHFSPRVKPRLCRKWQCLTSGPMLVLKKVNRLNYVLQTAPRGKTFITNIDKMKKYHGEVPKEWETAIEKLRSAERNSSQ
jgi:hypothetical protein